ncbi:MAG TPA: metallophosphoesterase [Niabella sp.]|nr:metallophosphoesterase [Niabella sp.]
MKKTPVEVPGSQPQSGSKPQPSTPKEELFSIVVIPDTQYYISEKFGGTLGMFENQIKWILKNRDAERIGYVAHLGDITESNTEGEWKKAKDIMTPLLENDIPFGVAIGNHDQTPYGKPSLGNVNSGFNVYFGKPAFSSKDWYGGSIYNNNSSDSHYDLFSANGENFIAIYIDYNEPGTRWYDSIYELKTLAWTDSLLNVYRDRKAIIISHCILELPKKTPGTTYFNNVKFSYVTSDFAPQGKNLYEMVKLHKNVFLMLCGHYTGESLRIDTYDGHTIKTFLTDYQFRGKGGGGMMRLMRFSKTRQTIAVSSFIPDSTGQVLQWETDADSQYEVPLYN